MKNTIRNLIVGTGILVLLTHTVSAQWVQIGNNLFRAFSPTCLAVSGGNLFAGTMGGGVFRCPENDTAWTAVNCGNIYVHSLSVSGNNLFAGTSGGGVFLSTNNGANWNAVNSGLTTPYVFSFAVNGSNLFAGTSGGGVFLSTNNGTNWTAVNSGLTNDSVFSLAASGSSIFASTTSSVYHSSNNGATWTAVGSNSGLPASSYCHLAASGNNVFAGKWGMNGIYRSSNNGVTWTAVNSGLPESTMVMSFAVSSGNIFAGTSAGSVFLSTDSGTSWAGFYDGLPGWGVDGLAVGESYIFASVAAHAMHQIWRRPLSEIVGIINGKPQQGIVKPYAGGFKINISKTSIAVLLPENLNTGAITVGLFTIAGKRIYSATHQACNGSLNVPVLGLSTGTYLMSIRGNTTTLSSPFVVTK